MSLLHEQHRSLLAVRRLMYDLLWCKTRPKTIKELKARVFSAMRHFPPLDDRGKPIWSKL